VDYDPEKSRSGTFGGNSNWRGPIWFPINYLVIEALERYHHFFGDDFKMNIRRSGKMLTSRKCEGSAIAIGETFFFRIKPAGTV